MGNLTSTQLEAISGGQPIRQVFSIKAPVLADHSSYTTTVIDSGLFAAGTTATRVLRCGTRTHKVWNPHPMEDVRPEAVRYSIEVANGDGYFHRKSGSPWNPFGIYDASPIECFLIHQLYVFEPSGSGGTWTAIPHMDFIGRIIEVNYSGGGSLVRRDIGGGTTAAGLAPNTVTIVSEQVAAWETLRRVFNKDDGIRSTVGTFTTAGTALTTTSISPTTKVHGAGTFSLTVNGTGFTTRTEIFIDGSPRTTGYVSSTQVSASILAADIATAGTKQITAYMFGPGGALSNAQTLTVT